MIIAKKKLPLLLLLVTFLFECPLAISQQVSLRITGDETEGYHINSYHGPLLVAHTKALSLELFNNDLSTVVNLPHWKGHKWTGNNEQITLTTNTYLKALNANLPVSVTCQVVNTNRVKKTVELFQLSLPGLPYILKQTARPAASPEQYVMFEYDSFPSDLIVPLKEVAFHQRTLLPKPSTDPDHNEIDL